MPSTCPKCHHVLEHDEICCAQIRYTWKCRKCHKLSTGFALPYGKCFLCGGDLALVEDRELGDPMRLRAIREAVQFELNAFYFYKLAREQAKDPRHRLVLERLYEAELDHLHELSEKYHAHLDAKEIDMTPEAEKLLAGWLFQDLDVSEEAGLARLYESAVEMEKRTRDHFRKLAGELPEGLEKELCLELASEEDEHIAMLETEMAGVE
jgi:glutamate synthase (NADPH) small chain